MVVEEAQENGKTATEPAATTAGNVEDLLKAQVQEKESKYLYLYAEFENFKKRAFKERQEAVRYGWEGVARELLEVADNLDRALHHAGGAGPVGTPVGGALKEGIAMVAHQFKATLQRNGVQPLATLGKPFDPNFHEAVGREFSTTVPEGSVLREEVPGYLFHERLLRAARVVVSAGTEAAPGAGT